MMWSNGKKSSFNESDWLRISLNIINLISVYLDRNMIVSKELQSIHPALHFQILLIQDHQRDLPQQPLSPQKHNEPEEALI